MMQTDGVLLHMTLPWRSPMCYSLCWLMATQSPLADLRHRLNEFVCSLHFIHTMYEDHGTFVLWGVTQIYVCCSESCPKALSVCVLHLFCSVCMCVPAVCITDYQFCAIPLVKFFTTSDVLRKVKTTVFHYQPLTSSLEPLEISWIFKTISVRIVFSSVLTEVFFILTHYNINNLNNFVNM